VDRELIAKIADEIVRRLEQGPDEEPVIETLAVVCDYVIRGRDVSTQLWERFGGRVQTGALRDGYAQPGLKVARMTEQEMLQAASQSENVVFLFPNPGMLQKMAREMDGGYLENLFFRCLLLGKNVHVMLDYSPPSRYKRGTFFQAVAESLDTLVEMGVSVFTCRGEHAMEDGLALVTENEVAAAYKQKNTRIACQKGAIVTPAAWDRAKELNIQIEWQGK